MPPSSFLTLTSELTSVLHLRHSCCRRQCRRRAAAACVLAVTPRPCCSSASSFGERRRSAAARAVASRRHRSAAGHRLSSRRRASVTPLPLRKGSPKEVLHCEYIDNLKFTITHQKSFKDLEHRTKPQQKHP
ncbi:hypothetical protein PIB30_075268 [Stylosanthes scabra]|uniref:Uncharacterized protein n=1 Tax=Stylosanthes scabra TaxID=79078 RepID=A0ABU6SQ60_9FABA|nr:hypothetical protein [Stylosanthes scabra]